MDDAAANELRRTSRALAGAAGALLPVRLAAAAAYLAASLGRMSPLAALLQAGQSTTWWISGMFAGDVEELGRQLGGTGLGALDIEHIDRTSLAHAASPFLAARPQARPGRPCCPGWRPLIRIRPRSASTRVHGEVLNGDALDAHPPSHPQSLEDPAGGGAAADGTRVSGACDARRGRRAGREKPCRFMTPAMPLPLLDTGHVNNLARGEDVGAELLAEGVLAGVAGPDLDQVLARRDPSLLEVPGARLGRAAWASTAPKPSWTAE